MIGNKYLANLYNYEDEDTSFNQLLEMIKSKEEKFLQSLTVPIDLEQCTKEELVYLTKLSALIDYALQINNLEVPKWIRDKKLVFEHPYFHPKRMTDFDYVRLQFESTGPFMARNVFFDMSGLERV